MCVLKRIGFFLVSLFFIYSSFLCTDTTFIISNMNNIEIPGIVVTIGGLILGIGGVYFSIFGKDIEFCS